MPIRSFAFLVPVAFTAMLVAARTAQADEWHKTYTVSGKATVHVETNDGAVRVSTWDGKQIEGASKPSAGKLTIVKCASSSARAATGWISKRASPTLIGI